MVESIKHIAEWCAATVEGVGIGIIVLISLYSLGVGAVQACRQKETAEVFQHIRHRLGRGILLGLEFLVAADIIHTVAVELTFETVGVLAIIVLIRTFLSFSLELELTGRWPWQSEPDSPNGQSA